VINSEAEDLLRLNSLLQFRFQVFVVVSLAVSVFMFLLHNYSTVSCSILVAQCINLHSGLDERSYSMLGPVTEP